MFNTYTFLLLLLMTTRAHAFDYSHPLRRRQQRTSSLLGVHKIREFQPGDAVGIQRRLLLSSADGSFDPEGPLEYDCANDAAIQESYGEDGCFLVAVDLHDDDPDDQQIIGTAGLVMGTAVSYDNSGASLASTTTTTGAIRRVCATSSDLCEALLCELERRAASEIEIEMPLGEQEAGTVQEAGELIALAYPLSSSRPTPELLETLGYERLETQLKGVDAVQYGKRITTRIEEATATGVPAATALADKSSNAAPMDVPATLGLQEALLAGIATFVVVCFLGIAQWMGLDVFSSSNAGLGSPLTSEELSRLQQDERLQRTDLDGKGQNRQWQDLTPEEYQEEVALMKIIQGKDLRLK